MHALRVADQGTTGRTAKSWRLSNPAASNRLSCARPILLIGATALCLGAATAQALAQPEQQTADFAQNPTKQASAPVVAAADADALFHSADAALTANKQVVYRFLLEVVEPGRAERAQRYLAKDYVEHDPTVPAGQRVAVAPKRTEIQPRIRQPLVAVVAEGDLVALAKVREASDAATGERYTTTSFEAWRIRDGKIAEHWATATLADAPKNRAPAVPVMGAKDPDRLFHSTDPKLHAHKQVAYRFLKDVIEAGHWADVGPVLVGEDYVQHNPNVPNGRDATIRLFTEVLKFPVSPIAHRLKKPVTAVIAEGDYLLLINPRAVGEPGDPSRKVFTTAWGDLWRFSEGKMVEHWDASIAGQAF